MNESVSSFVKRQRGSPRVHDVDLEKSYLSRTGENLWRCKFGTCAIVVKHLNNARKHVRNHLQSPLAPENIINENEATGAVTNAALIQEDLIDDEVLSSSSVDEIDRYSAFLPPHVSSEIGAVSLLDQVPGGLPHSTDYPSCTSADLLNAVKLHHNTADRAAINFLELMKLPGFRPETIRHADIKSHEHVSQTSAIKTILRCSTCLLVLENQPCPENCSTTPDSESFIQGPLAEQVLRILRDEKVQMFSAESYRKARKITDNIDGEEYKLFIDQMSPVLPKGVRIITLTINTDGVSFYESNGKSTWPYFLVINELSKETRFLERNMICFAIWEGPNDGPQKPPHRAIFQSLADVIRNFNLSGTKVSINGENVVINLFVTKAAFDTIAKANVLNMTQHNGQYGCPICETPGKTTKKGKGHTHSYADSIKSPSVTRTNASMMRYGELGKDKAPVFGMKGIPHLSVLPYFDSAAGVVIDDLHAIFEGIVKKIASSWAKCLAETETDVITKRMLAILPPTFVQRSPRPFNKKSLKHFKGNEFRTFLFYYFVCCKGVVSDEKLAHFALLVEAVSLLSKPSITVDVDLVRARIYLHKFCKAFENLYDASNYGINVHYMEHLTDYVNKHGSLSENSLFYYESMNGVIRRMSHGTMRVGRTIFRHLLHQQVLHRRMDNSATIDQQQFIKRLKGKRLRTSTAGSNWKVSGSGKDCVVPFVGVENTECATHALKEYGRAEITSIDVCGDNHTGSESRCSSYFLMTVKSSKEQLLARITRIGLCPLCEKLVLQAQEIDCEGYSFNDVIVSHIYVKSAQSGAMMCVYSDDCLLVPCYRVQVDDETFYCAAEQWHCSD